MVFELDLREHGPVRPVYQYHGSQLLSFAYHLGFEVVFHVLEHDVDMTDT